MRTVHGFSRPPMLANEQRRWHWSWVSRAKTQAQFAVWAAVLAHPRVPALERVRLHSTHVVATSSSIKLDRGHPRIEVEIVEIVEIVEEAE